MSIFGKSLSAGLVGIYFYLNGKFGPLFWALLILVLLDILFNLTSLANLENQFKKIGSAMISLGGPVLFLSAYKDGLMARMIVGVLVLAYLEVLFPQFKAILAHLKLPKRDQTALYAELVRVRGELDKLAKESLQSPNMMETNLSEPLNPVTHNPSNIPNNNKGPQVGGGN